MLSSTVAVYSSILLYVCVLSERVTFWANLHLSRIVVSFDPNKMVANGPIVGVFIERRICQREPSFESPMPSEAHAPGSAKLVALNW